jgi:class 3 adenylate cyclase
MSLRTDLEAEVAEIFRDVWDERDGNVVPEDDDVGLGNEAVKLKATVLYADLADSTVMVDGYKPFFAAEIYKTFLHCAAKIIRNEGGEISAYDGDRIMAVFIGNAKNSSAVRAAMKIKYSVQEIINPAKQRRYTSNTYELNHVVGIDTSSLFIARTGVRGANDLVWVGRAANYAAKLSALPSTYSTYITKEVYDVIWPELKTTDDRAMWEAVRWNTFDDRIIYRSNWWWRVD